MICVSEKLKLRSTLSTDQIMNDDVPRPFLTGCDLGQCDAMVFDDLKAAAVHHGCNLGSRIPVIFGPS